MFSPSLLYDPQTNQKTVTGFHAIAMCHVAKLMQAGFPEGLAATLQMSALGNHQLNDQDVPRYLLGRDAYGYQVVLCPAASWKDQWSDIMQSGLGNWPDFAATGFLALNRVAQLLYADLITRVTVADNLFLASHGPYAGVMLIVAKKLIAAGYRVRHVVNVAMPRSFTDAVWNALDALDVSCVSIRRAGDYTAQCPPSTLSYDGWGRGIINYATGVDSVLPDMSRFGLPTYVGQGNSLAAPNDQGWPNVHALLHIGQPLHWHDNVPAEAIHEGSTDWYIQDVWHTLVRAFHARLNDWRTVLNASYNFQLHSLENLGI